MQIHIHRGGNVPSTMFATSLVVIVQVETHIAEHHRIVGGKTVSGGDINSVSECGGHGGTVAVTPAPSGSGLRWQVVDVDMVHMF